MVPNHGGDTILGPMWSHWVKKMGPNRKKLPCPKMPIFDYPAVIDFSKKMEVTVIAPNHGGDTILAPMGSHWVKKMGQNRKKLPCPKIRIFDYPTVIGFSQKSEVTVMAPNHGGDLPGSFLGPMGSHWVKKWVKIVKNYHAPKFEFPTTPWSSIFPKKWKLRLWSQITVGIPKGPSPRVHLGSKKWVKTVKNYHAPKFEFCTTPRSSIFPQKWKSWLWCQMTVRTP